MKHAVSLEEMLRALYACFKYQIGPLRVLKMSFQLSVARNLSEGAESRRKHIHVLVMGYTVQRSDMADQEPSPELTVLYASADRGVRYDDVGEWEVIHDRLPGWESSLNQRFEDIFREMEADLCSTVHQVHFLRKIEFQPGTMPEAIVFVNNDFAPDRATCRVTFSHRR